MTRRGSLAYYLAAWVCGCTFMGALVWIATLFESSPTGAAGFLFVVISLSLMSGAVTSLLFGFFLRRVAIGMRCNRTWQWLAIGAILGPILVASVGWIASWHALQGSSWHTWLLVPLSGPRVIRRGNAWLSLLAAPAGAVTAWVLFRIERAFAARPSDMNA